MFFFLNEKIYKNIKLERRKTWILKYYFFHIDAVIGQKLCSLTDQIDVAVSVSVDFWTSYLHLEYDVFMDLWLSKSKSFGSFGHHLW